jgi:TonB-linked SusC/RagA family outer membrane protein
MEYKKHSFLAFATLCAMFWAVTMSAQNTQTSGGTAAATQSSQQARKTVRGVVADETGEPLAGASVVVKGSTRGVSTDEDGVFSIDVSAADVLEINYLGYETLPVKVGAQTYISVKLEPKKNELDEVTVVAFGRQKKESVVASISAINTKELKIPSSNLTTAFQGRIAGLISYQTSGEPGYDNASFFIRGVTTFGAGKVDPLILVDNVEVTTSDLANLHPDDLASFAILKDATATALYGARGANGVILISTKEGQEGKPQVKVRVENSFSSPTSVIEMADPITYMQLANEAVATRNPLAATPYSKTKIDNTQRGTDPYAYPVVDWMSMLIKDQTSNQRANINISGGGQVARYYVAGSFSQDNGILKVDKRNNFNNNINYKKYLLHSNININVTKTTEMIVRLHGTFNDYQGPITGGSTLYRYILMTSPVRFPAYYEPDEFYSKANHILFGNDGAGNYYNPYAEMLKGYKQTSNSTMMAQLELKQNFSKFIDGLSARIMGNTSRYAAFDMQMAYNPFYYTALYNRETKTYTLNELNPNTGTEYLNYSPGDKTINYSLYSEGSLNYSHTFGADHDVSGMLVGMIRQYLTANATNLSDALPERNLGLSGRFTYGYGKRYFAEFNFGYNGSEKFDKGHRWGFFPSFGVGWTVSNEDFWTSLKEYVSLFKLRGTYGLVGNDAIGGQRFFYISKVTSGGGGSFTTGKDFNGATISGYKIDNYANSNITWEISYKTNIGIELGLLKDKLMLQADIFNEHRTNILQSRADIPTEQGLWVTPLVNLGEANGSGVDVSLDYNHNFNKDLWMVGRANFTYARSTYAKYEEVPYAEMGAPWRTRVGRSVSQQWGYIAEKLFIDDYQVQNSARQNFGQYGAGDIKYKDLNNDGTIDELDMAPIGYPSTPEINYGFGLSAGYKGFDASFFFSGSDRSSFFINSTDISPFITRTADGRTLEGGLIKYIADSHWTEQGQDPYAKWPRLSNTIISNNVQTSTWYMYDNHYLRLKSVELGWSMPDKTAHALRLASLRIYASGSNLALFSNFKLWDVEMGSSGLNYPIQRVINVGLNVGF